MASYYVIARTALETDATGFQLPAGISWEAFKAEWALEVTRPDGGDESTWFVHGDLQLEPTIFVINVQVLAATLHAARILTTNIVTAARAAKGLIFHDESAFPTIRNLRLPIMGLKSKTLTPMSGAGTQWDVRLEFLAQRSQWNDATNYSGAWWEF